jgi:hypothetical protein
MDAYRPHGDQTAPCRQSPRTRQLLIELLVQMIVEQGSTVKESFDEEGIKEIDIRKVLDEIFCKAPIIGIPLTKSLMISEIGQYIQERRALWSVRKFTEFRAEDVVAYEIPDEFRPVVDTTVDDGQKPMIAVYDVSVSDLLEAGLLSEGEILSMIYAPLDGSRKTYEATVNANGSLSVLGDSFPSPSYAALACMQDAGSKRNTVNGWVKWRNKKGQYLSQIREEYLQKKEAQQVS